MVRKTFRYQIVLLIFALLSCSLITLVKPSKVEAGYDPGNLCSDQAFINTNILDLTGIQAFLVAQGSYLQSYSENGISAAGMIYNASQAYGINPIAILATLQKEQGLITGPASTSFDQTRSDWAMGYGYTDSGQIVKYKGFGIQVDFGTWQLRYNYDNWAQNGSVWNVGNSMTIDGQLVTFRTKSTSALYRYTPHLQGNYNFYYYFKLWGGEGVFNAQYLGQGPRSGLGIYGTALLPGQSFTAWVNFLNTGNTTWSSTDAVTPVHLGTWGPNDRLSPMMGNQNLRGILVQDTVPPGQIGTFILNFSAPAQTGTYFERFRPVAENVAWFGQEMSWTYTVSPQMAGNQTSGQYVSQGPVRGPASYGTSIAAGDSATLSVTLLNTGSEPWFATGNFPVHLGDWAPQDRGSAFTGGANARGHLIDDVYPGQTGTLLLDITAPATAGTYIEHFRPVLEGITWFGPDISWQIIVR
ncbi:MAG: NBR1-Ig-like domain-containing protein [Patescibacteria group bacterium]